jgi:hypothetical protein
MADKSHSHFKEDYLLLREANEKMALYFYQLRSQQNSWIGIFMSLLAAFFGALMWGWVTFKTDYHAGFMTLFVGLIVGLTMRFTGKGIEHRFGFYGACITLLGSVFGDYLSKVASLYNLSAYPDSEISDTLVLFSPPFIFNALWEQLDILLIGFYVAGCLLAFRLSYRIVSHDEVHAHVHQEDANTQPKEDDF